MPGTELVVSGWPVAGGCRPRSRRDPAVPGAEPMQAEVAAYHCQQAVEKVAKAFLVAAGVRFRKTHSIDELAGQVAPIDQCAGDELILACLGHRMGVRASLPAGGGAGASADAKTSWWPCWPRRRRCAPRCWRGWTRSERRGAWKAHVWRWTTVTTLSDHVARARLARAHHAQNGRTAMTDAIGVGIVGAGRISDLHAIEYLRSEYASDRGRLRSGGRAGDGQGRGLGRAASAGVHGAGRDAGLRRGRAGRDPAAASPARAGDPGGAGGRQGGLGAETDGDRARGRAGDGGGGGSRAGGSSRCSRISGLLPAGAACEGAAGRRARSASR